VVFAGFSAEALAERIIDAKSKVLLTADEFKRGGKVVPLKVTADLALAVRFVLRCDYRVIHRSLSHTTQTCTTITHCFVLRRTAADAHVNMLAGRDHWLGEAMANARPYCAPAALDSEDTLFLLYTSGSTGRPKGMLHTQAGYLLYTAMTHQLTFDVRDGDRYGCMGE
jgi:acetyl-CoA synthetase